MMEANRRVAAWATALALCLAALAVVLTQSDQREPGSSLGYMKRRGGVETELWQIWQQPQQQQPQSYVVQQPGSPFLGLGETPMQPQLEIRQGPPQPRYVYTSAPAGLQVAPSPQELPQQQLLPQKQVLPSGQGGRVFMPFGVQAQQPGGVVHPQFMAQGPPQPAFGLPQPLGQQFTAAPALSSVVMGPPQAQGAVAAPQQALPFSLPGVAQGMPLAAGGAYSVPNEAVRAPTATLVSKTVPHAGGEPFTLAFPPPPSSTGYVEVEGPNAANLTAAGESAKASHSKESAPPAGAGKAPAKLAAHAAAKEEDAKGGEGEKKKKAETAKRTAATRPRQRRRRASR